MSDVTSRAWFRWATGMRTLCGLRVYAVDAYGTALGIREADARARPEVCALPHDARPDWTDAGTLGFMTQRARDLWGDPRAHLVRHATHDQPNGPGTDLQPAVWWALADGNGDLMFVGTRFLAGPTEFATLLAACDAAPGGGA